MMLGYFHQENPVGVYVRSGSRQILHGVQGQLLFVFSDRSVPSLNLLLHRRALSVCF
jgi:hypothetical protein